MYSLKVPLRVLVESSSWVGRSGRVSSYSDSVDLQVLAMNGEKALAFKVIALITPTFTLLGLTVDEFDALCRRFKQTNAKSKTKHLFRYTCYFLMLS